METNPDLVFDVFHRAKAIPSGAERDEFLETHCRTHAGLRPEIDVLLLADQLAGDFLSPVSPIPTHGVMESSGDLVGRYRIVEKISEGGWGVVYLAEQERPVRRAVALKIIKLGMDTRQVVARFEAERQALALMDHANIARVYDAGATETGRPFFVMELVPGTKLTAYCDERRLGVEDRLHLLIQVCHAIQHAHQKGVIHRDIKPSNVLVMDDQGTAVPKVIDFGIAKAIQGRLSDVTIHTEIYQFIGTPAYMSPEQADPSTLDVDTRTDVYSLGVLLYELLTGCTPFDSGTYSAAGVDEMRRAIRSTEAPKPSTCLSRLPEANLRAVAASRRTDPGKLMSAVRGDLNWIAMKCLEKDPRRRYQSASGLAADLQRHLNHEPIVARPPSPGYRFRKAWQRNRVAFSAAMAIVAALLVTVATLSVSTFRIGQAQLATKSALLAATDARKNLELNSYFQSVALAHRELSADNLGGALKFLEQCPVPLRDWEWNYLKRLSGVEPVILQHATRVHAVAFHPDGRRVAAACGDGTVKIWDVPSRRIIQVLQAPSKYLFTVAFRPPHGQHLAAAGSDGVIRVWDWTSGMELFHVPGPIAEYRGLSTAVAFSKDGKHLIADAGAGAVSVRDADDGRDLMSLNAQHERVATCIDSTEDGRLLATGSWAGVLRIWSARTGDLLAIPQDHEQAHTHRISGLCFAPDGRWVATASYDRMLKLWDTATGKVLRTWEGSGGLVSALAISPDGRRLASCGVEDKMVKLWDPLTGREILSLRGHTAMAQGLAFSPDGLRLASCSHDGTIRIWDATPLHPGERMHARTCLHDAEVWSVAYSPDGKVLASGSWDNTARLWEAKTGKHLLTVQHPGSVFHVAFSAEGQLATAAFAANRSAVVTGWNPITGERLFALEERAFPFCVTFDPSGENLIREAENFALKVTNVRTNQHAIFGTHEFNLWAAAFSPDGTRLLTGSSDGTMKLWSWPPEKEGVAEEPLWTKPGRFLGYGERVAFGAKGDVILSGGDGNTVQISDAGTGAVLHRITGHTGEVWAVAVDRENRWIASAGEDTTIRIWDAKTWKPLRTLRGHTGFVMSLAFSPDGTELASGSRDQTVKFWKTSDWGNVAEP